MIIWRVYTKEDSEDSYIEFPFEPKIEKIDRKFDVGGIDQDVLPDILVETDGKTNTFVEVTKDRFELFLTEKK